MTWSTGSGGAKNKTQGNTVKVHCCVLELISRQILEQITAEESFNTRMASLYTSGSLDTK